MSLLKRLFRIGAAEANAAVDKLENPTKIAEQVIRELKENLQEALTAEAQIKAIALETRANEKKEREQASQWEEKVVQLMSAKNLTPEKQTELANSAATTSKTHADAANKYKVDADKQDAALSVMDKKIKSLRDAITEAEHRAQMIKSNEKVADASLAINKALSNIDTDSLMSTLDKMEAKTSATQFLADAYESVDNSSKSTAQEIDDVLAESNKSSALDEILKRRGITQPAA